MSATSPKTNAAAEESMYGSVAAQNLMTRVFGSCSDDPKGSVHRAWGLTLIFLVIFFVVAAFESTYQAVVNARLWYCREVVDLAVPRVTILTIFFNLQCGI